MKDAIRRSRKLICNLGYFLIRSLCPPAKNLNLLDRSVEVSVNAGRTKYHMAMTRPSALNNDKI